MTFLSPFFAISPNFAIESLGSVLVSGAQLLGVVPIQYLLDMDTYYTVTPGSLLWPDCSVISTSTPLIRNAVLVIPNAPISSEDLVINIKMSPTIVNVTPSTVRMV